MLKKSWEPGIDKSIDNIADIFPMSDISKGMIFHSLRDENPYVYHNQMIFFIEERGFDIDRLEKALTLMIEKHQTLRTGFKIDDCEEPVQIVYKKYQPNLQYYHLFYMPKHQQEKYIKKILLEDRHKAFDISGLEPLWRVKIFMLDDTYVCFIWIGHHAIMDGWSTASLMTELYNTYVELKKTPQFVPTALKSNYKNFLIEQLVQKKRPENINFWRSELDDYKRFNFWATRNEGIKRKDEKKRRKFKIDAPILDKIKPVIRNYNTSLRNLCFAAYIYMLRMISYDNDILTGFIVNNRPVCEDGDKIIGCFLNTIPVRIRIPDSISWRDYIKLVDNKLLELAKYNRLSFFEIVEIIGEKNRDENPILDTIFNYIDFYVVKLLNREIHDNHSRQNDIEKILNVESSGDSNTIFDFSIDATFGYMEITIYYSTRLEDQLVQSLVYYFEGILGKVIYTPDSLVKKEELIPNEEKQKLLNSFNAPQTDYPDNISIHRLFDNQVTQTPDRIALINPCEYQHIQLSYKESNRKSNQLARKLINQGVKVNSFIGLMIPNSIDLILGMLGAIKTGSAYLPIDSNYPETRINLMLKDSKVMFIIGEGDRVKQWPGIYAIPPGVEGLAQYSSANMETLSGSNDPFYIIYTSGSLGVPKGVIVKQKGFINLLHSHRAIFREDCNSRMSQVANPSFDAMAFEVWPCLLNGAILSIANTDMRMDPAAMKDWLLRHEITISFQPTVMAELLLREEWPRRSTKLKVLRTAGDKLRRYPPPGCPFKVYNLYGPTEDTVWTTWAELASSPDDQGIPPIGRPIVNHQVYIVDTQLRIQPIGSAGELCIGGAGVADGYLNQVELTAEKFLFSPRLNQCRLFRTGDLAKWLFDGNIYFLGRIDKQIKIRGFRIELGEIEHQLLREDSMKEAIVVLRENQAGDKYICAYFTSEKDFSGSQLKHHLSKYLPHYMIPSYFKRLEVIPLTPNGKIDKNALPEPESQGNKEYFSPMNSIEEKLAEIWAKVLGIDKENLVVDPDFFELGGHSVTAVKLLSRLQKEFDIKLKLSEIFKFSRLRDLGNLIATAEKRRFVPIKPVEKKEYYSLSSAQKRLYTFQEINPQSVVYNIPQILVLRDNLERTKLLEIFKTIINRYESLRTSFELIANIPVQIIHPEVDFKVQYTGEWQEVTIREVKKYINRFIAYFDLSKAPLLRVAFIKINQSKHLLVVDMHHIISDAVSASILEKEFWDIYRGEELAPRQIQYKDFSEWQNSEKGKDNLKKQEAFWLKNFAGEIPLLDLPTDFPRSAFNKFEGGHVSFKMGKKTAQEIKRLALKQNTTVFTVMLTIYYILLAKLSKSQDIVVGTVVEGRSHPDLENVVGMFVNILALRNFPSAEKTFEVFLKEVRNRIIEAFENQDFQFDSLIENLKIKRQLGRNSVVDVGFQLWEQNRNGRQEGYRGWKYTGEIKMDEYQSSKVDMTFHGIYTTDSLLFTVEYCTHLFKKQSLQHFTKYYKEITATVLKNPHIKIENIELISRAESQEIVTKIKEKNEELNSEFQF